MNFVKYIELFYFPIITIVISTLSYGKYNLFYLIKKWDNVGENTVNNIEDNNLLENNTLTAKHMVCMFIAMIIWAIILVTFDVSFFLHYFIGIMSALSGYYILFYRKTNSYKEQIICLIAYIPFSYTYVKTWIYLINNNIDGIDWIYQNTILSILGLGTLSILSFKRKGHGYIFGIAMIIYDCIMVYGLSENKTLFSTSTNNISLMESTAVKYPYLLFVNSNKRLILGLGDVIIPGIIINTFIKNNDIWKKFISIFLYTLGIIISLIVAINTEKGQPALVFIIPLLLLYYLYYSIRYDCIRSFANFIKHM